jgi:glycolate oxidase iron-sulfur subunit
MQTNLAKRFLQGPHAAEVDSILRKCVHCGFCNATCPTYQLLGDELDGPRGRIYQMKQYFEGEPANTEMLKHLDRCLTCRACETTCPSGVKYSHLLEIGKQAIEQELPRPGWDRWRRQIILRFIYSGWPFALALGFGRLLRPIMPGSLKRAVPPRQKIVPRRRAAHARKILMLGGCVQPVLTPNTNNCAVNLLDRCGIEVIETSEGMCCGAAAMHTSDPQRGYAQARRLVDAWWPHIETGAEAIVVTATGCAVSVADFGRLLADDPEYAERAARVSELYRDMVDIVEAELDNLEPGSGNGRRVAVHTPCSMQHGLGLVGRVERLLERRGYEICAIQDSHLCCGSAGTYSMLQHGLADRLRRNKLRALTVDRPEVIATANVGCQVHLADPSEPPVVHWIELI